MNKVIKKAVADQLQVFMNNSSTLETFSLVQARLCDKDSAGGLSWLSWFEGQALLLFLLDISVTFDTMNSSILLRHLEGEIGIKGWALDWFKSFPITDQMSSVWYMSYEIHQNAVLFFVLFNIKP